MRNKVYNDIISLQRLTTPASILDSFIFQLEWKLGMLGIFSKEKNAC